MTVIHDTRQFADVEALIISYLAAHLPGGVSTDLPDQAETKLPWTRVTAGPGSDDEHTEQVLVDVETFTGTRWQTRDLAEQTRVAMRNLQAQALDGDLVDRLETASRPQYVAYGNPGMVRFIASYRLWHRATVS